MRKIFLSISMAAMVVLSGYTTGVARAQTASGGSGGTSQGSVDQDIALMRQDLRSQKKQIVAVNMQLTDKEAEKFWPVYDQYTAEMTKINDAKYAAIKEYADNYTTLTDDRAVALTKQVLGVDKSLAELRTKYVPLFEKVIPGKKTGLFFQVDRRLTMLIDLQLAAAIPMVQQ
jgi:hypothetical protein